MTGGRVLVLGRTGRNFAAGMSGGVAYVYDPADNFRSRCNQQMVELEGLSRSSQGSDDGSDDETTVLEMLRSHVRFTGSTLAAGLLADWDAVRDRFVKVIPKDYKRVLLAEARARAESREPAFNELVGAVVNG
jgi:glutamate synthase domain-containing protein 3